MTTLNSHRSPFWLSDSKLPSESAVLELGKTSTKDVLSPQSPCAMAHQIPAGCKGGGKGGWPAVPHHQANQPVVYYGQNGLEVKGVELGLNMESPDPHIPRVEKRGSPHFFNGIARPLVA